MEEKTKLASVMDDQKVRIEALALHCNRSADTIKSYRAGRTKPDAPTAILIAQFLGKTVEELFDELYVAQAA